MGRFSRRVGPRLHIEADIEESFRSSEISGPDQVSRSYMPLMPPTMYTHRSTSASSKQHAFVHALVSSTACWDFAS
ncbi:unnamed protein product [Zymoseptoria tritici ST99CH_3D7]|uniref:Uncharacterized protein n=1 Tax=Zymoseptoria tritici (strain ST99CH_3D7) TaxID=1276538 RepID=A0A1X7RST1_ZYMT9|nr:unnamed protein product [Zymoseptoria tritici ST99CH_3D7]